MERIDELYLAKEQAQAIYREALMNEAAALETLRQTRAALAQCRRGYEAAQAAYGSERDRRDAFRAALCEDPD